MSPFRVRRADEHREWRALRMLLPDAIHYGCGCDVFVATDDEAFPRIIAVIAVTPRMRRQPYRGPNVAIHTIEPWRRRGVARALLAVAAELAATRGAKALYGWRSVSPSSQTAQAYRGLGFNHEVEAPISRIDATPTVELLQPLFDRLEHRGRIPTEARLVSLRDADPDEVVDLATTHLARSGSDQHLRRRLLGKHPQPMDPVLSQVLLCGNRVVGAMLVRQVDKQSLWVEANVIHPSVRGGWANVWLKLGASRRARDQGYNTFHYETYSQHADTNKLTHRLAGELTPRVELYRCIT